MKSLKINKITGLVLGGLFSVAGLSAQSFQLQPSGYFMNYGINVMAFDDIYPEGHQGGVSLIMNGKRLATNGDIRLEATPGQWQPVPKQLERKADVSANQIVTRLCYPDSARHMRGFNPMIYPDLQLKYTVTVKGTEKGVVVTVDLDRPIPEKKRGKRGFKWEFFLGGRLGEFGTLVALPGSFLDNPTDQQNLFRQI